MVFLCIVLEYETNYSNHPATSTIYKIHQSVITLLFYSALYFILFFFPHCYLFNKKVLKFYLLTIASILLTSVCLAFYQTYLQDHFPPDYQFILTPIHFDFESPLFLIQCIEIVLKFSSFYIILLFVFLARNYFIENKAKEVIMQKQTEMELLLLKSQINPHFLFNVLNSIYSLSIKKSDKTPEVVMRLSDILRYMLYESNTKYIGLRKEIQLVLDYLEIEKMRNSGNENIRVELNGDFDKNTIAPLLLLPFVENAVKHGTNSMIRDSYIYVSVSCVENKFIFICENSFKQVIQTSLDTPLGGIGVGNVKRRLELAYPNHSRLSISSKDNIFSVKIELTLEVA
ncbi:hypothetical protein BH11BAC7_BH11BAC7_27130 [soil metagenome]